MEDLPHLQVGRSYHGCGSFLRADVLCIGLLVAGGMDSHGSLFSSTEMMTTDSATWMLATPLPSARSGLKGVTVDNKVYMTGSYILYFNTVLYNI